MKGKAGEGNHEKNTNDLGYSVHGWHLNRVGIWRFRADAGSTRRPGRRYEHSGIPGSA